MAEGQGAVRKAPKSAIPAQTATRIEKTRVNGMAAAEAEAGRMTKATGKKTTGANNNAAPAKAVAARTVAPKPSAAKSASGKAATEGTKDQRQTKATATKTAASEGPRRRSDRGDEDRGDEDRGDEDRGDEDRGDEDCGGEGHGGEVGAEVDHEDGGQGSQCDCGRPDQGGGKVHGIRQVRQASQDGRWRRHRQEVHGGPDDGRQVRREEYAEESDQGPRDHVTGREVRPARREVRAAGRDEDRVRTLAAPLRRRPIKRRPPRRPPRGQRRRRHRPRSPDRRGRWLRRDGHRHEERPGGAAKAGRQHDNDQDLHAAAKAAPPSTPAVAPPPPRPTRSPAETEKIRAALAERRDELREEYEQTISEIAEMQRDRLTDSAGDDQADTGTKTFEREQEISLANSIRERITQVERALDRLDDGQYGWCERCRNPIPVERLAAFPSATLCVTCKQLEERR